MIAAHAEELDEASSKQRESSDPGHGSYQNDSRGDHALKLSLPRPQNSASMPSPSAVSSALSESRINLEYDGP